MSQRLLRTRTKIEHAGIGFGVPEPHRLHDRVGAVLAVVYPIFNERYATTEGPTCATSWPSRRSARPTCSPRPLADVAQEPEDHDPREPWHREQDPSPEPHQPANRAKAD